MDLDLYGTQMNVHGNVKAPLSRATPAGSTGFPQTCIPQVRFCAFGLHFRRLARRAVPDLFLRALMVPGACNARPITYLDLERWRLSRVRCVSG